MKHFAIALAVLALAAACKDKKAEESAEQQMGDSAHMMSPTSEMEMTDSSAMMARDSAKK